MMGAALTWLMQIHMSWPLLLPFVAVAWFSRCARSARRWPPTPPRSLAVRRCRHSSCCRRCCARHGRRLGRRPTEPPRPRGQPVDRGDDAGAVSVLCEPGDRALHRDRRPEAARVLSASSLARAACGDRFSSSASSSRCGCWSTGRAAARRWPEPPTRPRWQALRALVAGSVLLVYASYWFVMEPPQAHAFYVLAPVAFLFAAYWWTLIDSPRARRIAAACSASASRFTPAWPGPRRPSCRCIGTAASSRPRVRLKQPEMFAHRREFAIGGGPASLRIPHARTTRRATCRSCRRASSRARQFRPLDDYAAQCEPRGGVPRPAVHHDLSRRAGRRRRRATRADQGHL